MPLNGIWRKTQDIKNGVRVLVYSRKAFDVEHAQIMFAEDYVHLPAWGIYDEEALAPFLDRARQCHVYMIGFTPKVEFLGASQDEEMLFCHMKVLDEEFLVPFRLPKGLELGCDAGYWHLFDKQGRRFFPNEATIQANLSKISGKVYFDVQYVGQAFGKDGSRNALDRLKKHETLQKISLKGAPEGHILQLLLLKIKKGNSIATVFNPFAKDTSHGEERIRAGLNKLFEPNEAERTTLYEASLIRHFEPKFNKEFKESFPSTNLKVLADCYDKDFAALVAEINFDDFPYFIKSEKQAAAPTIMALHNLHEGDDRDVFFGKKLRL